MITPANSLQNSSSANSGRLSSNARVSGFSLIVALGVMSFILVLAVAIISLTTVELQTASNKSARLEAEANAKTALMMALGELQETMGSDRRISARAVTFSTDERLGVEVTSNTPRSWWVGVSSSDPSEIVDAGSGNQIAWLVSGLNPDSSPADHLTEAFSEPVTLIAENSINTEYLTGGAPIVAGKINVESGSGGNPGGIAWIIDDNGMKAQLAATNPEVRNDRTSPLGEGLLPGSYDPGILDGMDALAGRDPDAINKMMSMQDLSLLGANEDIALDKYFDYTTRSRGVLSDVKKGGLKKDLTIAFENEDVFESTFGSDLAIANAGNGFPAEYILMDEAKFSQCADLQQNGYIHWEMLKDFYNIKRYIQTGDDGMEQLPVHVFSTAGLGYTGSSDGKDQPKFRDGLLGPHQIGNNSDTHSAHKQFPYGDHSKKEDRDVWLEPNEFFKHSPLVLVLQRLQQNAWLERLDIEGVPHIRTNAQLWIAHYNPYNIALSTGGSYLRGYPELNFRHSGLMVASPKGPALMNSPNYQGFLGRTQVTVNKAVTLGPGRSQVFGFQEDASNETDSNNGYYTAGIFGENVKDLTMESAYSDYRLYPDQCSPGTLSYTHALGKTSVITSGAGPGESSWSANPGYGNHWWKTSQLFYAPYSWDGFTSKRITFDNVPLDEANENTMGKFSFHLRITREPTEGAGPAIRPLVDANIRAQVLNTRWDSPLELNLLAAYSQDEEGEVDEQIMQMNVEDDPKGYAYWGADRDPDYGYDRVILFDVPRSDLVSLGQLQHANVSRFSYEPSYVIGNSYANLRIPQDEWRASVSDTLADRTTGSWESIEDNFNLYDASYLVNEVLWDSYIFTTIPQIADNRNPATEAVPDDAYFERLRTGDALLPNPRFMPYEPANSSFARETLQEVPEDNSSAGPMDYNAGHLMVDGAFNVNSTSVDAWEAFLSGTHQLPYKKIDANGEVSGFESDVDGVRFPRVHASLGGPTERDSLDENYWIGFRSLAQEEVRELAAAIVEQVKQRGPFLTLGDFINRKLEVGELGQSGALQAALDATVNKGLSPFYTADTSHPDIPSEISQGAGFPGQLLQGDILQALSPYMTVRSDTFTIRAYGETRSPVDNSILARVWCEATVQRYPDPVADSATGEDPLAELADPSSRFGRSFGIVSFRWLNPDEV